MPRPRFRDNPSKWLEKHLWHRPDTSKRKGPETTQSIVTSSQDELEPTDDPAISQPHPNSSREGNAQTSPTDTSLQNKESEDNTKYEWGALWRAAYEDLEEEQRDLIKRYENEILQQNDKRGPNETNDRNVDRQERLKEITKRELDRLQESQLTIEFKGEKVFIRDGMRRIVHGILSAKDFISATIANEQHATVVWAGLLLVLPLFLNPMTQADDAVEGFEAISDILVRYRLIEKTRSQIMVRSKGPSTTTSDEKWLQKQTVSIYSEVLRYHARFLKHYSDTKAIIRYWKDVLVVNDWKTLISNIRAMDKQVVDYLNVQSNTMIMNIEFDIENFHQDSKAALDRIQTDLKRKEQSRLLEKLQVLQEAFYFSRAQTYTECLAGTQVAILTVIQEWIDEPNAPPIFWLHGMAGTGKSTIARTVASSFDKRKRLVGEGELPSSICLGATFFFHRTKQGRSYADSFFTTLARQLVDAIPGLADPVCNAIEARPFVFGDGLEAQWRELIMKPLKEFTKGILPSLTIFLVIDALDECLPETDTPDKTGQDIDNTDIKTILKLFKEVHELQGSQIQVRVFLTSRPAEDINLQFGQMSLNEHEEKELRKVSLRSGNDFHEDDMTIFFRQKLEDIHKDQFDRFQVATNKRPGAAKRLFHWDNSWSSPETIRKLVNKSDGLFIFAATACRFLAQPKTNLADRLRIILESGKDEIDRKSPQWTLDSLYRDILETEVMRDATDRERVTRVSQFQKIVGTIVILSEPLSIHGLSEFISDGKKDAEIEIRDILDRLLSLLSYSEDENSIELLHLSFREFLVNKKRAHEYWIDEKESHTKIFETCLEITSQTLEKDICHIGRVSTRVEEIEPGQIERFLPEHVRYACSQWVYHFQRSNVTASDDGEIDGFLRTHFTHWVEAMAIMKKTASSIMALSGLLTYMSSYWDQSPELKLFVEDSKRFLVNSKSVIEEAPLQIYVSSLLFAPQKSIILMHFEHEIPNWTVQRPMVSQNWNPLLQVLKYGGTGCMHLFFSQDSTMLASESFSDLHSSDYVYHLWNTETWTFMKSFEVTVSGSSSAAFSLDSKFFACSRTYGVIEVWDVESKKSKLLKLSSRNDEFFDEEDYENYDEVDDEEDDEEDTSYHYPLQEDDEVHPHRQGWMKIISSPDGTRLISVCGLGIAHIWDLSTERLLHTIKHCLRGKIETCEFSPDGNMFLLGLAESISGHRNRLQLWDTVKGVCLASFKRPVRQSSSFCRNGKLRFVTLDGLVKFWDPSTETMQSGINLGAQKIASFSPLGERLLTISEPGQVRIWDLTDTTSCISLDEDFGSLFDNMRRLGSTNVTWFLPNGDYVTVCSSDFFYTWEAKTGRLWNKFQRRKTYISPDGRIIASGASGLLHAVEIREYVPTISSFMTIRGPFDDRPDWQFSDISPDGMSAIKLRGGSMQVLDTKTQVVLGSFSSLEDSDIQTALFSRDGTKILTLASPGRLCSVTVYDVKSQSLQHKLTVQPQFPKDFYRCWDTRLTTEAGLVAIPLFLSSSNEYSIEVWDFITCERLQTTHCGVFPRGLALSPDGKLMTSDLGFIWNIQTGEVVKKFESDRSFEFSPLGGSVAIMSEESVQMWCTNTWRNIGELNYGDIGLRDCSKVGETRFSSDGQWLRTNMGHIRVSSILDPSSGPLGKEITLNIPRNSIAEGGKELILIPRSNSPCRLCCPDPSIAGHFNVALIFADGSFMMIGFDDSGNRAVRAD